MLRNNGDEMKKSHCGPKDASEHRYLNLVVAVGAYKYKLGRICILARDLNTEGL